MKQNRKWKIPYTVLERRTFCFSSYKIWKLKKSKTVMRWSSLKKKEGFFCSVYFVQKNFFKICVLSQCKGYWLHSQNIHNFMGSRNWFAIHESWTLDFNSVTHYLHFELNLSHKRQRQYVYFFKTMSLLF